MELLERDRERAALETAIETGGVVVVLGEAGIGKTALVASAAHGRHALWGACDPLITPRPLGPLRDVAGQVGGAFARAVADGAREDVLAAAREALANAALLVIEDLHWADDATLDLVALLGRGLARGPGAGGPAEASGPPAAARPTGATPRVRAPGCLVVTARPDARREVRRVLSSLPAERIEPEALSPAAVARLAGRDAPDLHAITGGNPFFVTEALAAGGDGVPASVRDAVELRVGALSERARAVVELAAVVPGATELWLFAEPAAAIDECIAAGLLRLQGDALAFRHDLARRAVEDSIPPLRRRELDRQVLGALEFAGHDDPARLAHHARRCGDTEAILRLAPAAARAAGAAHQQALEQWEAALEAGAGEEALEGVAVEAYLSGWPERGIEARRALAERHADDPCRLGDDLRWLSRLLWWSGRGPEALAAGDEAIAILEPLGATRELAMALSTQSQLAMLGDDLQAAIVLGERAATMARWLDDDETVVHALTNVGTALIGGPEHERGRALLAEAIELTRDDDNACRALINRATATLSRRREDTRVDADLDAALTFAREHELYGYLQYALGVRANVHLYRGEWDAAEVNARASLDLGEQRGVSLCPGLVCLGRLQARRGEPEAGATLDEAWRWATATGELQRIAPTVAGLAEHAWLDDRLEEQVPHLEATYALADERRQPWVRADMAMWLRRAGRDVPAHRDDPEPYALAAAGDWRAAAAAWQRMHYPYEAAGALAEAGDVEALEVYDRLGASRTAAHLRRRLRANGVRKIPRGPRPASRNAPGGLTPRESEVLAQLRTGATNAEIAQALVISTKTVDHHVSAVLSKLGVTSRRELKGVRPL